MQIQAKNVDEYLEIIPAERQEALTKLRDLCREILVDFHETMEYGMPGYKRGKGEIEVAFASQKNYISFYVLKQAVMDKYRPLLSGLNVGKGCIRYSKPERIDFKIVENMLVASEQSDAPIC